MGTNLPKYKSGKSIATITTLVKQGEIKIMESLRRSRNSSHISGFLQSWEEVWSQVDKRRGDKPSVRKWEKWGKWEEVWSHVDKTQVVSENGNVSTQPAACAGGNNTHSHSLPETLSIPPRLRNTGCARPKKVSDLPVPNFVFFLQISSLQICQSLEMVLHPILREHSDIELWRLQSLYQPWNIRFVF